MNRFFVNKENINASLSKVIINDLEDIKHIVKVLRLKEGDIIEVCNSNGKDYEGKINKIEKNFVECKIVKESESKGEPPIEIVLFQGIPKQNKMDLIVQKGVELGITKIVPIITERTVVRIKDIKAENKKVERWNKIALEAAKQSKRGLIPQVNDIIHFDHLYDHLKDFELILIPYEKEDSTTIREAMKGGQNAAKIAIIIGPEGGFDTNEVIKSQSWGAKPVSLGPRILRTETAGFAAASIILYELGDLGGIIK